MYILKDFYNLTQCLFSDVCADFSQITDETSQDKDKEMKNLLTFPSHIKTKLSNKTLTKSDLEQFCFEKIYEELKNTVIIDELKHELEQIVTRQEICNKLSKVIQEVSRQVQHLTTVNQNLLSQIQKQKQENVLTTLEPMKLTRSIGLQVKLSVENEKCAPNRGVQYKYIYPSNIIEHNQYSDNNEGGNTSKLLTIGKKLESSRISRKDGDCQTKSDDKIYQKSHESKCCITIRL